MHFATLLIALLSAGALASPLEPRFSGPTIGNYASGLCTGPPVAPVTRDHNPGKCLKFEPGNDNIGINWGGGTLGAMSGLTAFTDDNCENAAAPEMCYPQHGVDAKGTQSCFSLAAHGGKWKSVRFDDGNPHGRSKGDSGCPSYSSGP